MKANEVIAYIGLVIVGSLEWIDPTYKIILGIGAIIGITISIIKFYWAYQDRKQNKKNK